MEEATTSLLSALLGAIVGALAAYYPAAAIARRQVRVEHARDFVSSNYLPFLAAISRYKFALAMWAQATHEQDASDIAVHELGYVRSVQKLGVAVERVFDSGVPLVLLRIDPILHGFLIAVHARFQTTVRTDVVGIEKVGLNPEVIMELEDRLEALSIPKVVAEYERLMSDDSKTPLKHSILDRPDLVDTPSPKRHVSTQQSDNGPESSQK